MIKDFTELYSNLGLGGVVVLAGGLLIRYFMRENKRCYETMIEQNRKFYERSLKVIEENTASNVKLTNAVEENRVFYKTALQSLSKIPEAEH